MKQQSRVLRQLELRAQLSGQPLPGVPIVEMTGDRRVLIENHCGVKGYSCSCVCVGVPFGCVVVEGSNLEISQMSASKLVITGVICSVRLERSRG